MSALLAIGLNNSYQILSAVAIISFIVSLPDLLKRQLKLQASFSIGLGPVPFLLVSELVPSPAIPALSSLALSCNWIANFIVAISFLPLRNLLSSHDPAGARIGEGRVFYIFTLLGVITALLSWRGLAGRPQT
jgi:SP family facilitated glucose transporter-like MFS transporter 3